MVFNILDFVDTFGTRVVRITNFQIAHDMGEFLPEVNSFLVVANSCPHYPVPVFAPVHIADSIMTMTMILVDMIIWCDNDTYGDDDPVGKIGALSSLVTPPPVLYPSLEMTRQKIQI